MNFLELAEVLLKRWKLMAVLTGGTTLAVLVISLVTPPKYTATAAVVPEEESIRTNLPSGLLNLASQFGFDMGGGSESPAFYAEVLQSETLRNQILQSPFPDPDGEADGDSALLLDILEIEGDTEDERLERGRRLLRGRTSIRVANETNIVSISVETHDASLSADVANMFINLLNRFNFDTRQSTAGQRRRFIEERMGTAEGELRDAETELRSFLERNRLYRDSPDLMFQYERLDRQVMMKQEVLTTLRRSYEEARIEEVNDTPVITVIDEALPPQRKSGPKRALNTIMAFFLGGMLGLIGAFGREVLERARKRDEEDFERLALRWVEVKRQLRSLLRR
jgi:uncharacterized protein involved in exopolysaccharide biosynthesis